MSACLRLAGRGSGWGVTANRYRVSFGVLKMRYKWLERKVVAQLCEFAENH